MPILRYKWSNYRCGKTGPISTVVKMVGLPLWQGGANFNGKKSGSNYRCGRDMSISTVKWSVGLPLWQGKVDFNGKIASAYDVYYR